MLCSLRYCTGGLGVPHALALDASFGRRVFYHSVRESLKSTNFMSIVEVLILAEEFSGYHGSLQLKIHSTEMMS
jgi:hypothetical protein